MGTEKIRVVVTGTTGMVGEGVLQVCLDHPDVEKVLVINRRPAGVSHPKLTEIIHGDFYHLEPVAEQLAGYNACFFCLGISSVGVNADAYYRTTYTLTLYVGETLARLNPGMTFCYISGAGTDSSEKGRVRWARVKGKTENDLFRLPFARVFAVRPGFIRPLPGAKKVHPFYKYIGWLFRPGRAVFPGGFVTIKELALAMLQVARNGYPKKILEGKDIISAAQM